jgi:N utilization substance protein A
MATSAEMLSAFRELSNTKQLERGELMDLLRDGIHAALMKKYGPNVRFELLIDEMEGTLKVIRLRQVVEAVEDNSAEISLEEAQFEDEEFQVGDMLEEEVPFEAFGRLAVQAAKQRIIQRVREGERNRIRDEFTNKVGELLSGEIQQVDPLRAQAPRGNPEGSSPDPVARRPTLREGVVQARGARDPAGHRRDPWHRPRSRQPDQGGRHLA